MSSRSLTRARILLRCESRRGERAPDVTEFRSLTVPAEADPGQFTPPPEASSLPGPAVVLHLPFRRPGQQVAKTAAGLAAAGLGAAISTHRGGVPIRSRAPTEEAAGPRRGACRAMTAPPERSARSRRAALSDEVRTCCTAAARTSRGSPLPCTSGIDAAALLEAVPGSARRTGFRRVGFLVDTLRTPRWIRALSIW